MKKVLFLITIVLSFFVANGQKYEQLTGKWENGEKNLFFAIDNNGTINISVWVDVDGKPSVYMPPITSSEIVNDSTILMTINVAQDELNEIKGEWKKIERSGKISYWSEDGTMFISDNILYSILLYNYDADKDLLSIKYFFGRHSPSFYIFTREKTTKQILVENIWVVVDNDKSQQSVDSKSKNDFLAKKYKFKFDANDSNKLIYEVLTGEGFFSATIETGVAELSSDSKMLNLKKRIDDTNGYEATKRYAIQDFSDGNFYLQCGSESPVLFINQKYLDQNKQFPNFEKLIGSWKAGVNISAIEFKFFANGDIINRGESQRTKFNSWRLKDNNTVEFEVMNVGMSFWMPWRIDELTDSKLILGSGDTQIVFGRL